MAKKNSQGPSAKRGSDLDTFDAKTMDPAFSKVAFSLKPGTVSKPVQSNFGWHLILVEKKFQGFERSLTSVEKKIAEKILVKRTQKNYAKEKAVHLVNSFKNKRTLKKAMSELGLRWKVTKPFKFGTFITGIGKSEEVISAAFKLQKSGDYIPRYFFINDSYYFFKLATRTKPDLTNITAKLETMHEKLVEKKERIFLDEWQNSLKKEAKILRNPMLMNTKPGPQS